MKKNNNSLLYEINDIKSQNKKIKEEKEKLIQENNELKKNNNDHKEKLIKYEGENILIKQKNKEIASKYELLLKKQIQLDNKYNNNIKLCICSIINFTLLNENKKCVLSYNTFLGSDICKICQQNSFIIKNIEETKQNKNKNSIIDYVKEIELNIIKKRNDNNRLRKRKERIEESPQLKDNIKSNGNRLEYINIEEYDELKNNYDNLIKENKHLIKEKKDLIQQNQILENIINNKEIEYNSNIKNDNILLVKDKTVLKMFKKEKGNSISIEKSNSYKVKEKITNLTNENKNIMEENEYINVKALKMEFSENKKNK